MKGFNMSKRIFIAFFILEMLLCGVAFSKKVQIGGVFDGDETLQKVFELSVKYANRHRHVYGLEPKTIALVSKSVNSTTDALEITDKVCDLFSTGIAAIFGPTDPVSAKHIQSICDVIEVPHITINWDPEQERLKAINLFPHAELFSEVFYDLVQAFEWQKMTIIYDSSDSLIRMQKILKMWNPKGYPITIRRLGDGPNYRPVLKTIKDSSETNLIIDCSIDILGEVLKQALQVGILSDRNRLIVANLDLQTLDLESYQYTGINFTGIRLLDPSSNRVQEVLADTPELAFDDSSEFLLEHALMFDAVQLFALAFKQLTDAMDAEVKSLSCEGSKSWAQGTSLSNFMRSTEMEGLTGLIKFDTAGYRSDFTLDIIQVNDDGVEKIGTYDNKNKFEWIAKSQTAGPDSQLSLRNTTFRVLISLTKPYGMLKETSKKMTGNEQYEGYAIDIIEEISKMLGFNYTFMVQEDKVYGSLQPNGEWNGMLRRIIDNEADLGICDLTITSDRESAVDFTNPFMNLGIAILFRKPTRAPPSFMSFLSPFSNEVYMYLMGTFIVISVAFLIIGRMSPAEWNNPYPCVEEPEELETQWSFKNALWFTLGSIMQQGSDVAPLGPSTRILAGCWYFFCLIIVSSYTANLAAFLTVETVVRPINNVDDLVNQNTIKYGAKKDGSTISFFKGSNDSRFQRMHQYMMDNAKDVLTEDNEPGVEKVKNENYAFMMESSSIEYIQERECNLSIVGNNLDSKGYGIAMRKNTTYRNELSAAVLKLQENGVLDKLKNKWWKQKRGGGRCSDDSGGGSATELGLENVGGVFLVLVIGVALALIITVVQFILNVIYSAYRDKESIKNELKKEILFALKCSSTKPVAKRKSSSDASGKNSGNSGSTPPYGFIPSVIPPDDDNKK